MSINTHLGRGKNEQEQQEKGGGEGEEWTTLMVPCFLANTTMMMMITDITLCRTIKTG
jgi:hypothetical protein